ncbi:uncharacterized protein LOC134346691 isoform X2 [Mobula hypostoma]|uniref:uncharacterized protein LOC134346691 isoform X2 n=1 Tax=Mobula hypostoma TaxID=723540 RepID=UPI002FC2A23C
MHPRRPEFPSPHSQPRWFAVWEALRTVPRLCDLGNISHPKMRWSDQEVFGSLVAASVREREVNGIVGQSALLSGSYCKPDPGSELTVKWNLYPDPTPLVKLIRTQCSPHPDKPGYNCSDRLIITPSHRGRVHLYPDNGSLLLCDLRSSDSGVYAISVYCGGNSSVEYNVSLMVHNGTEKANSTSPTTPQPPPSPRGFIPALPICLGVIVVVAICLSLKMARTHWGCGRKSDTTEKIAQSNGVSREELDENRDQNSHVDITYTLLQLPLPDCPTTTQGHENCIIYSAPRKNKDQNLHVDLMYSLLQLPLPDSPTTQGPETCIIYSAPRKVW